MLLWLRVVFIHAYSHTRAIVALLETYGPKNGQVPILRTIFYNTRPIQVDDRPRPGPAGTAAGPIIGRICDGQL